MAEIDELFRKMVEMGASDLHMSVGRPPIIRESGEIVRLNDMPILTSDYNERLIMEIMPAKNIQQFEENWDTDFAYEIKGLARFRANVFKDRDGVGMVFRQIPEEILTADQLNLPDAVRKLCYLSKGLVVVTGPTGSGKSTTLAAMIDLINKTRSEHLITIEDPVEFVHKDDKCLINHREVHSHTKSFSNALRAALRQDPDIILVGEMRDLETIEMAIETAETGHLVFGTLHTNTASSTVNRIVDVFPANRQAQIKSMLATGLKGVIAQTLCKKKTKGRIAALETLVITDGIANLIREGKTYQIESQMQIGARHGMVLLNDALVKLVKENQVEAKEAYMKSANKEGLLKAFKTADIDFDISQIGETSSTETNNTDTEKTTSEEPTNKPKLSLKLK